MRNTRELREASIEAKEAGHGDWPALVEAANLSAERDRLRTSNKELVTALERLLAVSGREGHAEHMVAEDYARAALARAAGGKEGA